MKTQASEASEARGAAPIVVLADEQARAGDALPPDAPPGEGDAGALATPSAADAGSTGPDALARARAFAEPLLVGRSLVWGEPTLAHADGVAAILRSIGAAPSLQATAYLVHAAAHLQQPVETIGRAFGEHSAQLVALTRRLVDVQRSARGALTGAEQVERARKMLLAFAQDLRVVLLRLASRLQTLRWHAQTKTPCPPELALEARQVFAPLANRLGIWQIKWELEDYAFRFLQPEDYHAIAAQLSGKRVQREERVEALRLDLQRDLNAHGVPALVSGRPKHLYSIHKKMQGKQLSFEQVLDVRALRVIVADIPACYAALSRVHERYPVLPGEYDDYIARPKPNGYRSLHTVVRCDDGRPMEIQIRTQAMHEHAEHGVAAHWAYKEAGVKGYAGVQAVGGYQQQLADARRAVLHQLLAWERDLADQASHDDANATAGQGGFNDRIYVLTPQGAVVELSAGATPIDFAYAVHTTLGHRCRGAKVNGVLVPLNTRLASGQTVEITTAKEGGPSRDWLQADSGFIHSPRARAKVRAWFNAQLQAQTIARGREQVEKLLQREGKTAVKLDALAAQLGFKDAEALFAVVGKDEYSLKQVEQCLRPAPAAAPATAEEALIKPKALPPAPAGGRGGVLVVGVGSLLTSLARCCRPAPPDAISGFITRGKGVAIHRSECSNYRQMATRLPERVVAVAWDAKQAGGNYLVGIDVDAIDRPGLLRDVTEVIAKLRLQVSELTSTTQRSAQGPNMRIALTLPVSDSAQIRPLLAQLAAIQGVAAARRR